ncbi:hypothetical protein CROQUDRAFT_110356 [Cronartium quercuum f. sp. fusiforme G11]|uniref:Uncharacterized protein n=1 Tax=Cronartium quercuum f. sp. fusiforme G11 TaxID=708437 RepID=A0A9P6T8M7_9BASI|nr:hypothetical protein CROQUDRAFT_110356 [Cronartium quercuum f. sp. fusiforme G11]
MLFSPKITDLFVLTCLLSVAHCAAPVPAPVPLTTAPVNKTMALPPAQPVTIAPSGNNLSLPVPGSTGCYAWASSQFGCTFRSGTNNCQPKKTSMLVQQFGVDENQTSTTVGGFAAKGVLLPPTALETKGSPVPIVPPKARGRRAVPPPLQYGGPVTGAVTPPPITGAVTPPPITGAVTPPPTTGAMTAPPTTGAMTPPPTTDAVTPPSTTDPVPPPSSMSSTLPPESLPSPPVPTQTNMTSTSTPGVAQGICGPYYPDVDLGVCVWSGSDKGSDQGIDPSKSGWLNSAATGNCGKQVTVKRGDITQTFKIYNGCDFGTLDPAVGCPQIYLTKAAFNKLNPTPDEAAEGSFKDPLYWDFVETTPPV